MKIYGINKHTNFNIHENIVLCATKELAEREVLRLQKEDEDYWTETEFLIRKETRDPLYVCPRRGEFKYKIREVEVKEEAVINSKQKLISLKEDEINCLDQIYKNLKHLQLLYTVGDLKDTNKEFQISISLTNVSFQKNKAEKELEELTKK